MNSYQTFGSALQGLRNERGLSLHTLADRAGVHKHLLRDFEADLKRPTPQQFKRLVGSLRTLEAYRVLLDKRPELPVQEQLTHARDLWKEQPQLPVADMVNCLAKQFGSSLSLPTLHSLKRRLEQEKQEELAAKGSIAAKPTLTANPRIGRDMFSNIQARQARFLQLATLHPDWAIDRVNQLVREECGWGVSTIVCKELMAQARGISPGTKKRRATWGKAKRLAQAVLQPGVDGTKPRDAAHQQVRLAYAYQVADPKQTPTRQALAEKIKQKYGTSLKADLLGKVLRDARTRSELAVLPVFPPATEEPTIVGSIEVLSTESVRPQLALPAQTHETEMPTLSPLEPDQDNQKNLQVAVELLLEIAPGLSSLTISADGTVECRMRQLVERTDNFKIIK